MVMFRPGQDELDALETGFGMKGWNWESLLHYMKKVQIKSADTLCGVTHELCLERDVCAQRFTRGCRYEIRRQSRPRIPRNQW